MSRLLEEHQDEDKLVIVFTETKKAQLEDLVDIAHSGVAITRDKNTMGFLSSVEINYTMAPVRKALMDETQSQLREKKLLQCDICGDSVTSMQGCISCGILVSRIRARGVSSEHMENMEMFSCSPT